VCVHVWSFSCESACGYESVHTPMHEYPLEKIERAHHVPVCVNIENQLDGENCSKKHVQLR